MADHLTPGLRRSGAAHDLSAYPSPSANAKARGRAAAARFDSVTPASTAAHEAHAAAQLKKALLVAKRKGHGLASRG
jgi:hypothetical protein